MIRILSLTVFFSVVTSMAGWQWVALALSHDAAATIAGMVLAMFAFTHFARGTL